MKSRFLTSLSQDENNLLKTTTVFLFLILLLLLIFNLGQHPNSPPPTKPLALAPSITLLPEISKPRALVHSKSLYVIAEPYAPIPPAYRATPLPTPIPAGGGILRKIGFASDRADGRHYQLYMMDADGANVQRLTNTEAFDRDPHFSYNGAYLAFSSNRNHSVYQIFAMDLATHAVRQLTYGPEDKTNPFWSPDSQTILFTVHHSGLSELGIMNADGSDPQQLTGGHGESHGYGFSPDGRMISYAGTLNNRNEIFLFDLATHSPTLLVQTDDVSFRGDPVFSPVGHKLVFTSDVLAHQLHLRQLYIYDLDWKKYYRITDDEQDKDDPLFSPDGTKIAYCALWENAWNIFIMDADGKHTRNVTKSYYDNVVPTWR